MAMRYSVEPGTSRYWMVGVCFRGFALQQVAPTGTRLYYLRGEHPAAIASCSHKN
jgi:hypothetical protein